MPFVGTTFNRLYDWTDDRDSGIKIRADRFDNELDGIAAGLTTAYEAAAGQHVVNAQTGTSYAILNGDRANLITFSNGSSIAATIAQAGAASQFATGWYAWLQNKGAGTVTLTPTTSTVAGASTLVLVTNDAALLVSDGTNYQAFKVVGMSANGASLVAATDYAAMRALLDLEAGTDFYSITAADAAFQAKDSDLTALAGNSSNGLWARTGAGTGAARTITGTSNQISVSNGDGVSGAPTLSLDPSDIIVPAIITAPNTGLHVLDTNASHDLILKPGSDITADRTLTLTTGDADRTLTISASATVNQDYSTTGNPQFATIELGHASDTTISKSASGVIAVEGVVIPSISSTNTLTNKRVTPRIGTTASSATPTPTGDSSDEYTITAQAAAGAFAAPSGTPTDGQKLIIRIKDNGTARALTWDAIYRAGTDVALPTTTVLSKTMYLGFIYNSTDSKWDLVAKVDNI